MDRALEPIDLNKHYFRHSSHFNFILQFLLVTCAVSSLELFLCFSISFCLILLLWHRRYLLLVLFITSNLLHPLPSFFNDKIPARSNLLAFATSVELEQQSSYKLIGSASSYAQYLPWYPCLDGSLIFEFKTHEPNGLLLYTQALPYKYIQLSLVDGK